MELTYNRLMSEITRPEYNLQHTQVEKIRRYFLRNHKIDYRGTESYKIGNKVISPSVVNINLLPTICNFHTSYVVGSPVSLTGNEEVVSLFNKYYKPFHKSDFLIAKNLIKYGNSFEYVYRDGNKIKSKIFRNEDSFPIYDDFENLIAFVEHVKNEQKGVIIDTIYLPETVQTYVNGILREEAINTSGTLPIHYKAVDSWHTPIFGDSFMMNLINIMDRIEEIDSVAFETVKKNALAPILAISGKSIVDTDAVKAEYGASGMVLNLDFDGKAEYINASCDTTTVEYLTKNLEKYLCMVASIPSTILSLQNPSNISETSISELYALCNHKAKETIISLEEGYEKRWEAMRKIMAQMGEYIADEDFDLGVKFNITKPTDILSTIEALKMQAEMGALSTRSLVEQSPLTADVSMELERIGAEDNLNGENNDK